MGSGALCLGTLLRRPVGSGPPSLLTTLPQLTSSHTHITYFLRPSHNLLPHCLILYIHSLTYEPHGHIYYTHLTPRNSLNSSHSPHLTQPISFTFVPTSAVSFSDVFLFSVPFSVLNLCLIKLLTCGVIRSYNLIRISGFYARTLGHGHLDTNTSTHKRVYTRAQELRPTFQNKTQLGV